MNHYTWRLDVYYPNRGKRRIKDKDASLSITMKMSQENLQESKADKIDVIADNAFSFFTQTQRLRPLKVLITQWAIIIMNLKTAP